MDKSTFRKKNGNKRICLPNLRGTFSSPAAACIHKHSLPLSNYAAHQNQCMLLYRRKMRGWRETHPAKYESRDGRALSRVGGISTSSARLYFGNFTMKVGKYEKARICREKNAGSCAAEFLPTHRAGRNSARRMFIYRKSETEKGK